MGPYFIAIDFPPLIKQQLKSICFGLPCAEWTDEENFILVLRQLGQLNDQLLSDVKESLKQVAFLPFSMELKGIGQHQSKRGDGLLWTEGKPIDSLLKLKQQIEKELKPLSLTPSERSFYPRVTLAKYEHMADQRLGEYLMTHNLFKSDAFEVSQFILFSMHTTAKRTLFVKEDVYTANPLLFLD